MKIKKLMIFGTGFIASNLVNYFSDIEIIVFYNRHQIKESNNVKQYSMKEDIGLILKKENPEYIVVLYGDSFVSNNTSIIESTNHNVLKASNFLENINKFKGEINLKKIIVVGSASEYGKFYNKPIEESFELHPTSVYGLSKIFLYNVSKYFIERDLPIVYVRQFNTIGFNQRDCFVLASFVKSIVEIEKKISPPILNVGDLTQERDFIDIRDTCRAYELLLDKGNIGDVYNIASGKFINIGNLLDKIVEKSNVKFADIKISSNENLFSKEVSLSKRLHANIKKIEQLGFKTKYTIDDTIDDTIEYWRINV